MTTASPTPVIVLSSADITALLDLDQLIEAVAKAMVELSAGRASMPPRVAATVPAVGGLLAAMPAHVPACSVLSTKLVAVFPANTIAPTHQAVICCFDPATGTPTAFLDGTVITAARTAACSALATRLLARPDARVVTIVGTGVQALWHARALARVMAVERFVVVGRDRHRAETLTEVIASELGVVATAADSPKAGLEAADVVCAATHALDPVVQRDWLRPGTHVNSVGYNVAGRGEVDLATVRDAVLVVESRTSALAAPPAGAIELALAGATGVITAEHVRAEIGELVAGTVAGRCSPDEITLYKSVGVAVQDAAGAALVLAAATARGMGVEISL